MKFYNYLNEIISKEVWHGKPKKPEYPDYSSNNYKERFMDTFDKEKYKKTVFPQLKELFTKLNNGKLKSTLVFDFKTSKVVRIMATDNKVILLLIDMGYTINKDMYKTGIALGKDGKEKSVYDILFQIAKTNKKQMKDFYEKNPKPEVKKNLDFIESLETLKLIKDGKLDVSKLAIYKNKGAKIVFTYNLRAIASQSTEVGWTSCMNLNQGMYRDKVGKGASEGNFIAYLAKAGDEYTLEHPTGRVLFKPYVGTITNKLYWGVDTIYGTAPRAFQDQAQKIINSIQGDLPDSNDIFRLSDVYSDDLPEVLNNLTKEESDLYETLKGDSFKLGKARKIPEKIQLLLVKGNLYSFRYINKPTLSVQKLAVQMDPLAIEFIDKPSEEIIQIVVNGHPEFIERIENPSIEVQKIAINKNPVLFNKIKNPTEEIQIFAVLKEPVLIGNIEHPSEKLQDVALKNWPYLINYIKNPANKFLEQYSEYIYKKY